jgi:hypothetical protein
MLHQWRTTGVDLQKDEEYKLFYSLLLFKRKEVSIGAYRMNRYGIKKHTIINSKISI